MKKRRRMKRRISKPRAYKLVKSGEIDGRSVGQGTALSPKHRAVIRNYTDPNSPTQGNGTKSAIAAGYSPTSAHNVASRLVKSEAGERELTRIYEATGLTIEKVGQVVKRGLQAKYDQAFIHQKTGQIVYAKRRPDYNVQLKAARLAAELRGDMAPKQVQLDVRVAVLAGRLDAAKRRERERAPQDVVVDPSDKQPEPITPTEST
ncbi:hypothetical protein LCGC14_2447470 [marine sediment metagenome]|uniref:Terminase small subunit n=1 Tax=marine sediment metagenome TaxID=412755 RepID=A0A0F9DUA1_9ZZZZ